MAHVLIEASKKPLGNLRRILRDFDLEEGEDDLYGQGFDASGVEDLVSELNKEGFAMVTKPGVFSKRTFAVKGKDGLVVQKLDDVVRVFYSE